MINEIDEEIDRAIEQSEKEIKEGVELIIHDKALQYLQGFCHGTYSQPVHFIFLV